MKKVQTRDLGASEPESIDDWQATEVSFTTVRPLATKSVPTAGQAAADLAGGVKLEGHPALHAKARLSTAPLSTRNLGNITLPRLLYDDPSVCEPLTFTVSRGSDPGLSVLELTDVNDPALRHSRRTAAEDRPAGTPNQRARGPGRLGVPPK